MPTQRVIQATEFKARCLALIDRVAIDHVPVVITKRGRPVARLVALDEAPEPRDTMGSVRLVAQGDADYFSTGEGWDLSLILLDTHALLWWQAGGARLSANARRAIGAADVLLVSPVSFWEICVLARKGRIELDRDPFVWTQELLATDRLETAVLSPIAAVTAGTLPASGFPGDPADAFIYATALDLAIPLITKDQGLRLFASQQRTVRTVW